MSITHGFHDFSTAVLERFGLDPEGPSSQAHEMRRFRQVEQARVTIEQALKESSPTADRELTVLALDDRALPFLARTIQRPITDPSSLKSQVYIDFVEELRNMGLQPFFKASAQDAFLDRAETGTFAPAYSIAVIIQKSTTEN
jgi:hypothetical protein